MLPNKDRLSAFIELMDKDEPDYIYELEKRAKAGDIPIIRPQTRAILRFLLTLTKPEKILEVGTATGFSALYMREYGGKGIKITTIENYEKRILEARENFKKYDKSFQIELICGDAAEVLPALLGEFDWIFMDAAKGQYLKFLPDCTRLLKIGGLLISDNVMQDGDVIESRFALERRDRTIHSRMREYIYELKHSDDYETCLLSDGDGVALSVRI